LAVDVVCGMEVQEQAVNAAVGYVPAGAPETDPGAGTKWFYRGKWYYFCSMGCRQRFMSSPDDFIQTSRGT
jgi:YHS domain-containing protein